MPAETQISILHWNAIIDRIYRGECVPFLGAGINCSNQEYTGLPLGGEVAKCLLEELMDPKDLKKIINHKYLKLSGRRKDLERVAIQNLARVALHLEIEARGDYDLFLDKLTKKLSDTTLQPSPILKRLAKLPFNLIVTTNYDRLMERALVDERGLVNGSLPYKRVVQPAGGFEPLRLMQLEEELIAYEAKIQRIGNSLHVILYKIHGTFIGTALNTMIPDEDAHREIIITEEDYIQFLLKIGGIGEIENAPIPRAITSKMVYSSLLFLGYSLEDWDFRAIYKGLIERLPPRDQRISFAIQKDPPDFWVDFWNSKKVVIYNVDLNVFGKELEQRYQDKYGVSSYTGVGTR